MLYAKVPVRSVSDVRGWFAELLRPENVPRGFGQLSVVVCAAGQMRGGHYHRRKQEWFFAVHGSGRMTLRRVWPDSGGEEEEVELSADCGYGVSPLPGVWHALYNPGPDPLVVVLYCSEAYDAEDPDTWS